ncbi:MAG: hypothetical protein NXI22_05195 [bacterium]|nr:hypothetical protein [bacterium]
MLPPHRVRQLICDRLAHFGADAAAELTETILVREGYYFGRRFEQDGLQAVWFVEEEQIKFYHRDKSLLEVCEIGVDASREAA